LCCHSHEDMVDHIMTTFVPVVPGLPDGRTRHHPLRAMPLRHIIIETCQENLTHENNNILDLYSFSAVFTDNYPCPVRHRFQRHDNCKSKLTAIVEMEKR
jgi:hypothetical protein